MAGRLVVETCEDWIWRFRYRRWLNAGGYANGEFNDYPRTVQDVIDDASERAIAERAYYEAHPRRSRPRRA